MSFKKIYTLAFLVFGFCAFASAQTTTASKSETKKACCADKSKASCDSKKKSAFVKKTASTTSVAAVGQEKQVFKVSGVCGMCKMRIERAAMSVEGVSSAEWDVMTSDLTITYDAAKADVAGVEKAVAAVGHDTAHVRADDKVYADLHGCCKYERTK